MLLLKHQNRLQVILAGCVYFVLFLLHYVSAQFWLSVYSLTIQAKAPLFFIRSAGVPVSDTAPSDSTTILLAFSAVRIGFFQKIRHPT